MNGERRLQLAIIVLLALTIAISAYLVYLQYNENERLKAENLQLKNRIAEMEKSYSKNVAIVNDTRIEIVRCEVPWQGNVKVTVKNVWDKPLSEVYVIAVLQSDNPFRKIQVKTISNLWMGEEATVTITRSEEPFKIIVVAPP